MDNRRPISENAPIPSNQTNNYSKESDRQFPPRRYPPRDNQFQPRSNERFQPRNPNDRFQSRDERPRSSGDARFQQNRDERPRTGGDNRFQARDNRNPLPRTGGGFQPRNNERSSERSNNDRSDSDRNDRFQPRGRFAPRGKSFKPWEKPPAPIVSEMQVTDGKHRGKYIQSTTSEKVRPTARSIREVMFRILYRRIRAARFLDLCAGAGTVGIEAISRGAIISTFVERSAQMCSFIKKNMEVCGIKEGHGEVHQIEVVPFLKKMAKRKRCWDVVYFDPPTDSNYNEVLDFFGRGAALRPGGLFIIEHPNEMIFPEKFGVMSRWRVVVQGETSISFYEKKRI